MTVKTSHAGFPLSENDEYIENVEFSVSIESLQGFDWSWTCIKTRANTKISFSGAVYANPTSPFCIFTTKQRILP